MVDTVVPAAGNRTTTLEMSGTDTLLVEATGLFTVALDNETVRFNAPTNGATVTNSGSIINTDASGRAIRFENSVGSSLTASITNNATGLIESPDDAIQIQAGAVTSGSFTLGNAGTIHSVGGQAIDFAGGTGTFTTALTNSGTIHSDTNDAIRFGGVGNVTNSGTINGGSAVVHTEGVDGLNYEDNATGTVTNNSGGLITGDRHGIDGADGSNITVINNAGGQIIGRNGSGIGSDATASVTNFGLIRGDVRAGVANGDGDGIDIDFQATIVNHGTIEGTGANGVGGDGGANTSEGIAAGGGTITNHTTGIIRGLGLGILIDNSSRQPAPFLTTIVNAGIIQGINQTAIEIISNHADVIENSGSISGGNGIAILFGNGNNTLRIFAGSAITGTVNGEGGTNTVSYATFGAAGAIIDLRGGMVSTGAGTLVNFQNAVGSAGSDNIHSSAVANAIDGGGGFDYARYDAAAAGVFVNLANVSLNTGEAAGDTYQSIEGLVGSAHGDTLVGDAINNTIYGGLGIDVLRGQGGTDSLLGEDGNDTMFGGAQGDVMLGGAGNDVMWGEDTDLGTVAGDDGMLGGDGDDTLLGQGGNDVLWGEAGRDGLDGGDGNDTIICGSGDDGVYGGNGNDAVSGQAGADVLLGDGGDDILFGGGDADIAAGGAGNDTLWGDDLEVGTVNGVDGLNGGDGNDTILGQGGNDTLLGAAGDDAIAGGDGSDTMYGQEGVDILFGGNAGDLIVGGAGGDVLKGEAGGDLFVFNAGDNGDAILDFNFGGARDGIDLRAYFDATGFAGTNPRAAGVMQVLQNGADTDIYLHGAFAMRLVNVTAAAIDDTYFLFQ